MKPIFSLLAFSFLAFSCTKSAKADVLAENSAETAAVSSTPTVLNPAHGKPGHRCDIAVGAPLDMKAAQPISSVSESGYSGFDTNPIKQQPAAATVQPVNASSVQPETVKIVPQQPAKPANKVKTAPGMNPPHGEPNHRCDIAVGAPLNSPKAKNTVSSQPVAPPVTAQNNDLASGEKPAVNPAHGQPFHRCDLQVGEPLP